MVDNDLYREHQQLCHKLQMFINQARINEQKLQRFQNLELRLIGAHSLDELIQQILINYKHEFSLDTVTLTIVDENYEIQRFIQQSQHYPEFDNLIFCNDAQQLAALFSKPIVPQLGEFDIKKHALLLSPLSLPIKSIATVPLLRQGKLIGCLNLGSNDRERFCNEFGTEFLQRLATIVAISLENITNQERLKRVGLTDSLTGVNNRRYFDQRLGEEVARSLRSREPLACLMLDIDHFKKINDQHGHQVGDQVLRHVATMIRDQLRNSDVLGRYGGEEFSALLINTQARTAKEIAERIRSRIANHQFNDSQHQQPLRMSLSIGIGLLDAGNLTETHTLSDSLIKRADEALYQAKNSGRNKVILSTRQFAKNPITGHRSIPSNVILPTLE